MVSSTPTRQLTNAAEAFAAIALAAVACDGELAALEARGLRQQLEYRQPYCTYSDLAMADLLDRLLLAGVSHPQRQLATASREHNHAMAAHQARIDYFLWQCFRIHR